MKQKRERLTNEIFSGLFSDKFEMTIYAIKKAQQIVREGGETTMGEVLGEISMFPPDEQVRKDALQTNAILTSESTDFE